MVAAAEAKQVPRKRRPKGREKKRSGRMCYEADWDVALGPAWSSVRLGSQVSKCLESGSGGWDRGLRRRGD